MSPVTMQSTINIALSNAFASLKISPAAADRIIAQLWRIRNAEPESPPKTPPRTTVNIEKLNRQQVQKLESSANKGADLPLLRQHFLAYANGLTPAYFKSKSLTEHIDTFLAPSKATVPAAPAQDEDEDLVEVSYRLRTYDVGVTTHRVYEMRGGVHVFVGMLGMNEFEKMVMPVE